jgi:uncharacterized protein YbaR (Trm112 family)
MFIELTDHLRCPAEHEESYLVLLPERMEGRSVREGQLGCPVCGRTYAVVDGAPDLGGDAAEPPAVTLLEPESLTALTGLGGPGGYLVLVGRPASRWREVAELNPGVGLVAVNPGADVPDVPGISVLSSGSLPLKSRSMRGVVLGSPCGGDPGWVRDAARVVLPGLRVVGEGKAPNPDIIDLMAFAAGVWVGAPRR